jgi:sialidase-1
MLRRSFLAALLAPAIDRQDLFEPNRGGYALYRIPVLTALSPKTLLAFCEARKSTRGDWGPTDILLRRSDDAGRTWSEPRSVASVPGPVAENPVAVKQGLADPASVLYNNPVAVPGRRPNHVHFLFCIEYMRCFHCRSTDAGRTFSSPVEITAAFEALRPSYDWQVLATGPGHGIRLRNGRLLVPVWLSTGTGGHAHRPSVITTLYSDDDGASWRTGDIAIPNTPDFVNPSESALVQLPGGRILLNARTESPTRRRLITVSPDGISRWSPPVFNDQLVDPVSEASLISLPGGRLLFSNPATTNQRRNLTVRLSEDNGATWPASQVLEPGPSGYSHLAALPNGELFCLYERGPLTLARFNLIW